ncbi:cation/H(+) antiporter 15-like [Zingiber officinale]|uniref:cation/H(+) antiporter 15-like n=1 Tax=Zingiber officinale TaxID=94328 RepID=UPI001C4C87E2|nr:cation/H(+) antiporter 15-like [Zingiber officinale]
MSNMDYHWRSVNSTPIVCYSTSISTAIGRMDGDNPLDHSLPLFLLQLLVIAVTSRLVAFILLPLHQPRHVSEIVSGLVLGPMGLGQIPGYLRTIFPYRSLPILEVVAYLGIIYFVFITGLEIDPTKLKRSHKYAAFAAASMVFPFAVGAFSGVLVHAHLKIEANRMSFLTFLGATLSTTSFSVLARTLTELKLIKTAVGLASLSSAVFVDSYAWILVSVAFSMTSGKPSAAIWALLSGLVFFLCSFKLAKPAVLWFAQRDEEKAEEMTVCIVLVGAMSWALVGDALGINAILGAFIYGLIIPYRPTGVELVERVGDLVEGLLVPLFYALCGLRSDLRSVNHLWSAVVLATVVVLAAAAKVVACMVVGHLYEMPLADGFAMGLLMTTKGVIEMVILKIGRDSEVLSEQAYSILVVMSVMVTAMVTPLLKLLVTTNRRQVSYERRTIQWPDDSEELRLLLCIHNVRNVPSMLGLLEAAHPSRRSPVFVFSLHLVELTGRASAMLVVHDAASADGDEKQLHKPPFDDRSQGIIQALDSYAQRTPGVTIQPLAAVSAYDTMHEDVCGVAEDNCISFIILPFHKQPTVDGGMQVTNPAVRALNESVLNTASCSVAILVDRGFSGPYRMPGEGQNAAYRVAVLFFGGADDREALSLASRMADHPSISLSIFRFVSDSCPLIPMTTQHHTENFHGSEKLLTVDQETNADELCHGEAEADEACLKEFRRKHDVSSAVGYKEKAVRNSEETVEVIRGMEGWHELYVVGKGSSSSALVAGLTEWCECPQLGAVGDMLASSDFGGSASVLVVQQVKQEKVAAMKSEV